MTLEFPKVGRGGRLNHKHVNALSQIAKRSQLLKNDGYGINTGGQSVSLPPFSQLLVRVVEEDYEVGMADDIEGLYEVRPKWYDEDTPRWRPNSKYGTYFLDATALGNFYCIGDNVSAYWDVNRNAFIPTEKTGRLVGRADSDINQGAAGVISIYDHEDEDDVDTDDEDAALESSDESSSSSSSSSSQSSSSSSSSSSGSESHSEPATGSVSAFQLYDTGRNLTGYARLGAISVGSWVYLLQFKWGWEIVNAECG